MDKRKKWGRYYNYTFAFCVFLMVIVFAFDIEGVLYGYIFAIIKIGILISFVFMVLYALTFGKKK